MVNDLNETRETFNKALLSLTQTLKENRKILSLFPEKYHQDILNLKMGKRQPPRGGIYDVSILEREFFASNEFLSNFTAYWNNHNLSPRERIFMCKIFFLHELKHLEQRIGSDHYPASRNSQTIFQILDYSADAFAVKTCFLLEKNSEQNKAINWNKFLAELLMVHINGGEVFSTLDDKSNSRQLDGERLHRQMIWHFQYARAFLYKEESSFNNFNIDKGMAIEVFKLEPVERKENYCKKTVVTAKDFESLIEVQIKWGEEVIRYPITVIENVRQLSTALFENDFRGSIECFRNLFSQSPILVGREPNLVSPGQRLKSQFARIDKKTVCLLLLILAILAASAIIMFPMGMDNIQRVLLGIAVLSFGSFLVYTLRVHNQPKESIDFSSQNKANNSLEPSTLPKLSISNSPIHNSELEESFKFLSDFESNAVELIGIGNTGVKAKVRGSLIYSSDSPTNVFRFYLKNTSESGTITNIGFLIKPFQKPTWGSTIPNFEEMPMAGTMGPGNYSLTTEDMVIETLNFTATSAFGFQTRNVDGMSVSKTFHEGLVTSGIGPGQATYFSITGDGFLGKLTLPQIERSIIVRFQDIGKAKATDIAVSDIDVLLSVSDPIYQVKKITN